MRLALLIGVAGALVCASAAHASMRDRGGSIYSHGAPSPLAARAGSAIVAEASRFLGGGNPTGFRGPWCAAFVSAVLKATGRRPLANLMASSALYYGPRLSQPLPGALVVINGGRHVGFVVEDRGATIKIISGNWSRRVAFGLIARRQVVAFVRT